MKKNLKIQLITDKTKKALIDTLTARDYTKIEFLTDCVKVIDPKGKIKKIAYKYLQ